jgi:hypothetical protein
MPGTSCFSEPHGRAGLLTLDPGGREPLPSQRRPLEVADRYHADHAALVKDYRRYLAAEHVRLTREAAGSPGAARQAGGTARAI